MDKTDKVRAVGMRYVGTVGTAARQGSSQCGGSREEECLVP